MNSLHNVDKLLIIGESGFIGKHVTKSLEDQGSFDIIKSKEVGLDITDKNCFENIIKQYKPRTILNLAAISSLSIENIPSIYQINTLAVVDMLEVLKKNSFNGRFINASSALVYKKSEVDSIKESSETQPLHHYSVAKLAADMACNLYSEHFETVSCRLFNCVGIGHAESYLVPKMVSHFAREADSISLGNLEVTRDFVDVRDVARMFVKIITLENVQLMYNFSSGRGTKIADLYSILSRISGFKPTLITDSDLIRSADNTYMVGDNSLLKASGFKCAYSIEDTLRWMYSSLKSEQNFHLGN